jgi:hypothetical protein
MPKDLQLIVEDLISKNLQKKLRYRFADGTSLLECTESILDYIEGKEIVKASGLIE